MPKRGWLLRSGQVWGHTPEQRDAASNLRQYSFGLRLGISRQTPGPSRPYPTDKLHKRDIWVIRQPFLATFLRLVTPRLYLFHINKKVYTHLIKEKKYEPVANGIR